jgi:RNA polymerase sigma-70 factor (ECF subfamily)
MERTSKHEEQAILHQTEARLQPLLMQGLSGDEASYRRFLEALAMHLRSFFRKRMQRWPDEVEDLVQETLLAIHNQRSTYDASVPLTAWVFAIARYKLIDWLRKYANHDKLHAPLDDENEVFSSTDMEARESQRDLGNLLDTLPQMQRMAIIHTKVNGWSVRETAEALKISESSVKVTVHRGLKLLASKLRKHP